MSETNNVWIKLLIEKGLPATSIIAYQALNQ